MEDRCLEVDRDTGQMIVDCARRWIGTPYRHQASCRGVGSDCLGLVRGVWRELIGSEPETIPPYTADWAEFSPKETLLNAAKRHLEQIEIIDVSLGDILIFRMSDSGNAKHLAILSTNNLENGKIIHAYSGHAVCETSLVKSWKRRMVSAFRFPIGRS